MTVLMDVDQSRARRIAERLIARAQTIAVSESAAGGLISAALLTIPGASAYFLGGGVLYTRKSMGALLDLTPDKLGDIRSATEPMARLLGETIRNRLGADWGLAETGATGLPATGMGTPLATRVSPSRAGGRQAEHWKRDRATGQPTWSRSQTARWNYWRKLCSARADACSNQNNGEETSE